MTHPKLISTGEAAARLGVDRGTLGRWRRNGLVRPAFVTPTGHARWDLDKLRADIENLRKAGEG